MRSHGKAILRDAIALLQQRGATNIHHWMGGKHVRLLASYHGLPVITTVPLTPSDWRSGRNALADLKRKLRSVEQMVVSRTVGGDVTGHKSRSRNHGGSPPSVIRVVR
jgi:hypothetical protein